MDTPNTQNNTSRMRESRKLEQKRKRQQQVPASKDISCLFLSDPDCRNRFIRHTPSQSSKGRRPGGRTPETDKTKAGS